MARKLSEQQNHEVSETVDVITDQEIESVAIDSVERTPIFFYGWMKSIEGIDYVFDNPSTLVTQSETSTRAVVLFESIKQDQRDSWFDFLSLLGSKADNAGLVSYDENQAFQFYSSPMIGKLNGKIGLMVGAKGKTMNGLEFHSSFTPLVYENEQYSLNGKKVSFVAIPNQDNTSSTPYLVIKSDRHVYYLGLKYDRKDETITTSKLDLAFDQGKLDLYLDSFFGTYVSFNKMFSHLFKQKRFPQDGVLLLLEGGKVSRNDWNGAELVSSTWKVSAIPTDLTNLPVVGFDSDKVATVYPLSEIKGLYMNQSCKPTKALLDDPNIKRCWVYVYAPNDRNPDFVPQHTSTKDVSRLPQRVQAQFAPMIRNVLALPQSQQQFNQIDAVEEEPVF